MSMSREKSNVPGFLDAESRVASDILDLRAIPASQHAEMEMLYQRMAGSGSDTLTREQFEERVKDAAWLINVLSGIKALEAQGREQYAQNARVSFENFVIEEVVEHGTNAEELKEKILEEYKHVADHHRTAINLNYKSLEKVLEARGLRRYEEIEDQRRDRVGITGGKQEYRTRRRKRDEQLGYGRSFVVGALGTENDYDEAIGPAPFYGHGVIQLRSSRIANRVAYFEGDSMTSVKTAHLVTPRWLLRKWNDVDSRKLDDKGAVFSKALMEIYRRNRGYTHIHLTYVEAHIFGEVSLDDVESITYAVGLEEWRKAFYRSEIEKRPENDPHRETFVLWLKELEHKEQERTEAIRRMNERFGKENPSLQIKVLPFDKEIVSKEDNSRPGAQKSAITSDQLF